MIPAPAVAAQVRGLLADELKGVADFVAVLESEQALLVSPVDVDALLELVKSKSELSSRLAQLTEQREKLLTPPGGPRPGRKGMEAWLETLSATDAARTLWGKLMQIAARARTLNETNARLLNVHLQHNQQALAVLMKAANQAVTYGADGQQRTGGGGRFLGSA